MARPSVSVACKLDRRALDKGHRFGYPEDDLAAIAELAHDHLLIRARVSRPLRDLNEGVAWLGRLIDRLGMRLLAPPTGGYSKVAGNRGLTLIAPITTSHVAVHFWDESEPALLQFDIYSCAPLDMAAVQESLAELQPVSLAMKLLDRRSGLHEVVIATEAPA